jgi:hypothetical protein
VVVVAAFFAAAAAAAAPFISTFSMKPNKYS